MASSRNAIVRKLTKYLMNLPERFASLPEVLSGETGKTSAGFPYISEESFKRFLDEIPHLFADGNELFDHLSKLRSALSEDDFLEEELQDIHASLRVIETVVQTAAVTSVPDCWILKWVLSVWRRAGALDLLKAGPASEEALRTSLGADARLFQNDLSLLICRGILVRDSCVRVASPAAQNIIESIRAVAPGIPADMTPAFVDVFTNATPTQSSLIAIQRFFQDMPHSNAARARRGWEPTIFDIEAGYRLAPLVLALRLTGQTNDLRVGRQFKGVVVNCPEPVWQFLIQCGYLDGEDRVTRLGDRVFARGPGPFGIIHAYYPYMERHDELLKGASAGVWVERGKNVAASQDANRKTFELANASLDLFCKQTGFSYSVFIEHAVGQGEATRQRFRRPGGELLQFFGADLEDAAINAAMAQQKSGVLPANMIFVRSADIGKPSILTDAVKESGFSPDGAVMMVGNGFHEVRRQDNESMVRVFKEYCDAGIVLIFTEESGLSDDDLLQTGWNTYHAGFRYVHELSGQGLRPAHDRDDAPGGRYSWGKCAELGGYRLLKSYTTRTRTIFPHPRPDGYNPAISVNYFCIPEVLARQLGLKEE